MALGGEENQALSDRGMGLRDESPCLTLSSFLKVHIQRVALSSGVLMEQRSLRYPHPLEKRLSLSHPSID